MTAAIRDALEREREQVAVSQAAEVAAIAAQVEISTVTKTLIERIPVYVPADADVRFTLPVGLARLELAWCEAEVSADGAGSAESLRIIDGCA